MSKFSLRFSFSCIGALLCLVSLALADVPCTQIGRCMCSGSNGVIDLSPLDNISNPMGWVPTENARWSYKYNPCTGFTCGSSSNQAVCEKYDYSMTYGLGAASSAVFKFDYWTDENYIEYSEMTYTSRVYLVCDKTQTGQITSGPSGPANIYTFRLTSKYACPTDEQAGGWVNDTIVYVRRSNIYDVIFACLILAAYWFGGVGMVYYMFLLRIVFFIYFWIVVATNL